MSEAEQCPSNVSTSSYHRSTRTSGMCAIFATVARLVPDVSLMNEVDSSWTVTLPIHKNLNLQVVYSTVHPMATPHFQISIFNRVYSSVLE